MKSTIDQSNFPKIIDQGSVPMCASVAVSSMLSYYLRIKFSSVAQIDPLALHRCVEESPKSSPSTRLDTALKICAGSQVPLSAWIDGNTGKSFMPSKEELAITCIRHRSHIFDDESTVSSVNDELGCRRPVLIDIPLMASAFKAFKTGLFPEPYSIESDILISRHIVLAVGYDNSFPVCENTGKGAWLVRNCWGTGWGMNGLGWVPYSMTRSCEPLKVTFVEPA